MEDDDEYDSSPPLNEKVYLVTLDASKMREPTNLELAELIDINGMAWFCAAKCMTIGRDVLHKPLEMIIAQSELVEAQKMTLAWWTNLIENDDDDPIDESSYDVL